MTRRRSGPARSSFPTSPTSRRRPSPTPTATASTLALFNITRSYINVNGNISPHRRLPDHAGHRCARRARFSNLSGSLESPPQVRLWQFNLDDWMTKGSFARFGIQQTPVAGFRREHLPATASRARCSSSAKGISHRRTAARRSTISSRRTTATSTWAYTTARTTTRPKPTTRSRSRSAARYGRSPIRRRRRSCAVSAGRCSTDADRYVKDGPRNRFIGSLTLRAYAISTPHSNSRYRRSHVDHQAGTRRAAATRSGRRRSTAERLRGAAALRPLEAEHAPRRVRVAELDDRRRVALVPPPGPRCTSALLIDYDGTDVRELHPGTAEASARGSARPDQLLRYPCSWTRAAIALACGHDCGAWRRRRRRSRSTARARRSRIRSISKWFAEYNKLHPNIADQLPVDRVGRRHPADSRRRRCSSARPTGR